MTQLKTLETKFLALSQREQWMVFVAGFAVLAALANLLLITPAIEKEQQLITGLSNFEDERFELEQQAEDGGLSVVEQADLQNKEKIKVLKQDIDNQKNQLKNLHSALVGPQQIREMLRGLMRNHEGVRLVSMKTLPPALFSPQLEPQQNQSDAVEMSSDKLSNAVPVIFKHGIEMTFSGQYFDLMHYSDALQTLSDYVTWDSAELNVKAYPQSELTITVYTLSLDKTWLAI